MASQLDSLAENSVKMFPPTRIIVVDDVVRPTGGHLFRNRLPEVDVVICSSSRFITVDAENLILLSEACNFMLYDRGCQS